MQKENVRTAKFCIVLGTRPEIIKTSVLIKLLFERYPNTLLIHSGQHYSHNLDSLFFEQLDLPKPTHNLKVGSLPSAEQIGEMLIKLDEIFKKEQPDLVFVQGDTNTVFAGALAASRNSCKIAHIEAGLRSFDKSMPEETNRIMTDALTDLFFAPTILQKELLLKEGYKEQDIHIVGNTVVDAVMKTSETINDQEELNQLNQEKEIDIQSQEYILVTIHRQENVDNKQRFEDILKGIKLVANETNLKVIYAIHPRAKAKITSLQITIPKEITLIDPISFRSSIALQKNAKLIITDSGGIQEEACILKTPCVTVRDNTERPETVNVGANLLAGTNPQNILNAAKQMLTLSKEQKALWKNPFGDGKTSQKIIEISNSFLQKHNHKN